MDEHALLITHAERWADSKKRPLDTELLETVLRLVGVYDERSAQSWPPGSAEDLVLYRMPSHATGGLPDPDVLRDTLDTYWRFLRATGRMTSGSAAPADLVRELKRALPKMAATDADRSNWSQGRVLADFGSSIGIPLDDAGSVEELQGRLEQVTEAWNALPTEERVRLMPDPRPRTARGVEMTRMLNETRDGGVIPEDDDPREEFPHYRPGDVVLAGRQAESSPFVQSCLALADWVGDRREVTSIGVLPPAAAREAYDDLGLYDWEEAYQEAAWGHGPEQDPQARAMLAATAGRTIRSAAECRPLDRLWHSAVQAGLIDVWATVARRGADPMTDPLERALVMLAGLTAHLSEADVEALIFLLMNAMVAPDGEIDTAFVEDAWWERSPLARSTPSSTRCSPPRGPGRGRSRPPSASATWATVARRGADPMTDPLERALVMLAGLTAHLSEADVEALIFLLMNAMVAPDGEIDMALVRDAWWERSPLAWSTSPDRHGLMREIADRQVRVAQVMLDDSGAWQRVGDRLTITDLGRCLTSVLTTMWDDGAFVEQ